MIGVPPRRLCARLCESNTTPASPKHQRVTESLVQRSAAAYESRELWRSQCKQSTHAVIPGVESAEIVHRHNFCDDADIRWASPAELSDAPIVLGITGLNAWGRAGTSAETVMEAPLASGTGVLREENFSVLHFRAQRIWLSPRAARDGGERQKRCKRFHLRPPIRCVYGEAILPTTPLSKPSVSPAASFGFRLRASGNEVRKSWVV